MSLVALPRALPVYSGDNLMPERRWPKEGRGELEDGIMADAIPTTKAKPTYNCIAEKERKREGENW